MDAKYRLLLQRHQQDIIKDLDVLYVLDKLFSEGGIPSDDYNYIMSKTDRAERVRSLMDILIKKGTNKSYQAFVDCLAKDYDWLYDKFSVDNENEMIENSFEDSLSRGDVPRTPDYFVNRPLVEREVAKQLRALTRHKILALYGMVGSGKTVVATSVLRHNRDLVTANFNSVVFWLNLSSCKTEDDIVAQQNKLYRKAATMYPTQNSLMNSSISMSSIGSNADSLTYNYWTGEELKDRLKLIFEEPLLKEALLVLDEVNMKKCLEAFDIGCKILITTRDTEVVSDFQAQKVKIENHLTEAETLELLASCLDIKVNALPPQAKKLHNLCGGSPYDIALLAAEFAENREMMVHNTSRWNYYIKKLKNKEFFSFTKNSYKQMNAIQVCVDLLKPDVLSLFKMLAVLPDNVKVPAQVFCKLWHKEIFKVESIIKQLKTKSLIIQTYDREQKIYLYEIDCLIMNYLRTISNADTLSKLHLDLLRSYNYMNDTDVPVEIEDDGYIAYYIGYHLLNTNNLNNAWKMFSKLYLNLKFIGNKARITGIADVNLDLQKYETHIVDDNHSKDLLYSLKAYLNRSGNDLHRFPCTDIVQSILQNESQGILYTAAYNVARERCRKNELYFDFLHEQNVEELNQSVIDVREVVTYVCFLGNFVLVGTNNGLIKFFQIDTNQLIKEISAGGSGIKWLSACTVKPLLLVASLDYDGVLRVWHVDDVELEVGDIIEEESEESYNNNYPSNITIPSGPFINCCWASIEEKLIAHTAKAIYIYRTDGTLVQVLDNMYSDKRRILCCVPCNYDKHVIVASTNSSNNLELIDLKTKVRQTLGTESGLVLNILVVPGSARVLVLTEQQVSEHWYHAGSRYERGERCRCVLSCAALRQVRLLSMTVSRSGALLLVATDDARILCVDLKTYLHVFDLQNRRGNVVSMAMSELSVWDDFEPGADVLLTGTGTVENSAKVWYLDAPFIKQNTDKNGKVPLTTKFDASFIHVTSPNTPGGSTSKTHTPHDTPKRHQSFNTSDQPRLVSRVSTMSLDRHSLKPLNLKGICNGSNDGTTQPLVAVVDDRSNIQVLRGTKLLTQVATDEAETITALKITPCNHYVIYGLDTGIVKKFSIKTKEVVDIMDIYSRVEYLNFVNTKLLIVAGQNQRLMAYHYTNDGQWQTKMLQTGNANLGSQDLLNGIQGVKSRSRNDNASSSGSEDSGDKSYISSDRKSLCKGSNLVDCFWVQEIGLVTVESNATVKIWDKHLNVSNVLNGRQIDAKVKRAAMQKDILVLCHEYNFQTFRVQKQERVSLRPLSEHFRSHRIVSCALTEDGNILALGLDVGDIVIWNVPKKWQLLLLSHHKTRVQWCGFSPVPAAADSEPPLVLLTLATELVWWDISYLRARSGQTRPSLDAVTPITSPVDTRKDVSDKDNASSNFFFGSEVTEQHCWKLNWRKKTYKEGSKKKEILSCIKLSGIYARQVCHDDKFACFVTVDDAGHLHIMSVMDDLGI